MQNPVDLLFMILMEHSQLISIQPQERMQQ